MLVSLESEPDNILINSEWGLHFHYIAQYWLYIVFWIYAIFHWCEVIFINLITRWIFFHAAIDESLCPLWWIVYVLSPFYFHKVVNHSFRLIMFKHQSHHQWQPPFSNVPKFPSSLQSDSTSTFSLFIFWFLSHIRQCSGLISDAMLSYHSW